MGRRSNVAALAAASVCMVAGLAACQRAPERAAGAAAPVATAPVTEPKPPSPGTTAAQARGLPDFTELVAKNGPAVVNIAVVEKARATAFDDDGPDDPLHDFLRRFGGMPRATPQPARGEGSGFIVAPDGYILTNAHVVADASEVTVRLTDRREFTAKVVGVDRRSDVAVIKIDGHDLPTVRIGDPARLRPGEWVVAIGSPFGFDNSVTAGIVSATARTLPDGQYTPFIQTDVAINPGNSGGPLFNLQGEVVGINSQIYSRTGGFMGLSFAIPIDVAMDIQQQLRASGRVSRGRIGVVIQEVSKELAESFGLKSASGALVNGVEKGGPAEKAGVKTGDIIVRFDNKQVGASSDLPRIVGGTKPGSTVGMQVFRDGKLQDITVTVAEIPDDRVARAERGRAEPKPALAANRLGLVVSDLSEEKRKEGRVTSGVVVDEVRGAPRADIRVGDVIVAVTAKGSTTELKTAQQFNKLLGEIDKSTTLTLRIRRGEANVFATIRGETAGG